MEIFVFCIVSWTKICPFISWGEWGRKPQTAPLGGCLRLTAYGSVNNRSHSHGVDKAEDVIIVIIIFLAVGNTVTICIGIRYTTTANTGLSFI